MPRARGLFTRAILQSGAAHHVSSAATAKRIGERLAQKLRVPPNRDAIAALPSERILEAQLAIRIELMTRPDPKVWGEVALTNLPWQPTIDGTIVPGRPIDRIIAGAGAEVELIVGTNVEENRLFLVPGGAIDGISNEMLAAVVAGYGLPVEQTLAAYRSADPKASAGDLMATIQCDWYWRLPALRLADAHARAAKARTFMYEFAWRSPQFGGRLGACHSLEIPFVFDTLGLGTTPLVGPKPPQSLADKMHAAWVGFAKTGDPGWPTYDLIRRSTMRFDVESSVQHDPRAAERQLWEKAL
jgi:carboxylesterase 2/para-nitrobenzyl esterase